MFVVYVFPQFHWSPDVLGLWLCHVAAIRQGGDHQAFLAAQVLVGVHKIHILRAKKRKSHKKYKDIWELETDFKDSGENSVKSN